MGWFRRQAESEAAGARALSVKGSRQVVVVGLPVVSRSGQGGCRLAARFQLGRQEGNDLELTTAGGKADSVGGELHLEGVHRLQIHAINIAGAARAEGRPKWTTEPESRKEEEEE